MRTCSTCAEGSFVTAVRIRLMNRDFPCPINPARCICGCGVVCGGDVCVRVCVSWRGAGCVCVCVFEEVSFCNKNHI